MKRLVVLGLAIAALAGFAGTCTITNTSLTSFNGHKTFGGVLTNNSGANLLQHDIRVAFFNSSNQLVETKVVTGCLRSLQNGSSNFFSAQTSADGSNVTAAIPALAFDSNLKAGTTVAGNLTISNQQASRSGTALHVTGTIKNLDTTTLTSPQACAVVYNSSNAVVVVGTATIGDLAQNASGSFAIDITVPDDTSAVSKVDVWVDGLEGGLPVTPRSATGLSVPTTPTPTATSTACAPTCTPTPTSTATATSTATPTPTP